MRLRWEVSMGKSNKKKEEPMFFKVKPFGKNGAHIIVPKELIGYEVQLIVPDQD